MRYLILTSLWDTVTFGEAVYDSFIQISPMTHEYDIHCNECNSILQTIQLLLCGSAKYTYLSVEPGSVSTEATADCYKHHFTSVTNLWHSWDCWHSTIIICYHTVNQCVVANYWDQWSSVLDNSYTTTWLEQPVAQAHREMRRIPTCLQAYWCTYDDNTTTESVVVNWPKMPDFSINPLKSNSSNCYTMP